MNKMNNAGRLLVLLLAALMALSLAACGAKGVGKMGSEPKSLEEAVTMHKELMAEETAIFSENTALWEKVFMEADKGMAMVEDGKNYGEFLLDTEKDDEAFSNFSHHLAVNDDGGGIDSCQYSAHSVSLLNSVLCGSRPRPGCSAASSARIPAPPRP